MGLVNIALVPFLAIGVIILTAAYRLFSAATSPLRNVPGPWYSHVTSIVLKWHILAGRRVHFVHSLHLRYGPVVLVSPDEVAISDLDAFSQIHKIGSGFTKSDWYDKLRSGREPGIFFMRDPHQHAARRRLFARAFSNSSLLTHWEPEIRQKTQLAVAKIKNDAQIGSADVLKWWTLMATDVIAHLSFGESFRMLELGKVDITQFLSIYRDANTASKPRTSMPSKRPSFVEWSETNCPGFSPLSDASLSKASVTS